MSYVVTVHKSVLQLPGNTGISARTDTITHSFHGIAIRTIRTCALYLMAHDMHTSATHTNYSNYSCNELVI